MELMKEYPNTNEQSILEKLNLENPGNSKEGDKKAE